MIKELSTLAETATDGLKTYNLKERDYLRNITLLTYLITPWNRVLLEKLTGSQLVKKFPIFYGTQAFIIAFARARHLYLS